MFKKKDLSNQIFIGLVENVYDEKKKGRVQVRVQGVFNDIELEHIPWAEPQRSLDGRNFSVPSIGKMVNVIFVGGNIYDPQYIFSQNYNTNLQQKLDDMSNEEYENFAALLIDDRTQLYSDDTNLRLDYKFNQISLKEDGIDIHLKDNDQELHLGHNLAEQSAMLGDHFLEWMDGFMKTLLQPSSLVGNIGAPVLKPLVDQEIMKYQALRATFLSEHVKVVDNASCIDVGEDRKDTPAHDDITKLNEDKILDSKEVDEKVKEKIVKKREKDTKENEESKPNEEDKLENLTPTGTTYDEGDTGKPPYLAPPAPKDAILSEEEKDNVERTNKLKEKSLLGDDVTSSTNENTEQTSKRKYNNYDGYYGDSKASSGVITHDDIYGDYTPTVSSGGYGSSGSGGGGIALGDIKNEGGNPGQYSKNSKKFGKVWNGQIPLTDLTKITEWRYMNGNKITAHMEENSAKAWRGLVAKMKSEFPNEPKKHTLWVCGGCYRTYESQVKLKIKKPKLAATAGRSNHGWGVAADVNNWDGNSMTYTNDLYKFLTKWGPTFKIHNPAWAKPGGSNPEPWHWEYYGPSIYNT